MLDTFDLSPTLSFKTIWYDRREIVSQTTSFFLKGNDNEESILDLDECSTIQWLFSNKRTRNFLIEEFIHDSRSSWIFFNTTNPFTKQNKKPGDIDLIIVHPLLLQFPIAFECKRIKVNSFDGGTKINNSKKIKKAILQANSCRSLGFSLTYLMIIIQDDGRDLNTPNVLMRQGKSQEINKIYQLPYQDKLHPDIGVVFIYVSQITGRNIDNTGSIGICVDRVAKIQAQEISFTDKVISLFTESYDSVN